MAAYHAEYLTDLAKPSRVIQIPHQFAMGDNESHTFSVLVYDSDNPSCGLMDGTVSGIVVRPDGGSVILTGEKGDAAENVTLPDGTTAQATRCTITTLQACFAYAGQITVVIRLVDDETITAVFMGRGPVVPSLTDTPVDPGELIEDITTLIATANQAAEDAEDALEQASAIVSYAEQTGQTDAQKEQARANIGAGSAADVADLKSAMTAALACFERVAWASPDGQEWYDAFSAAINPPSELVSISATYTQGETVVYVTDSLDVLRPGLLVTATYADTTTATINAYALFGILTEGTSTITVAYGGKTTTFTVTVTDAALLYKLPQTTVFDGTTASIIDSGVKLLPEDRDITIVVDFTPTNNSSRQFLFYAGDHGSPYYSLFMECQNNSFVWRAAGYNAGTELTNITINNPAKVVIRHKSGSGKINVMCVANGTLVSGEKSVSVISNYNMYVGGYALTGNTWPLNGTMRDFRAFTRYFSDAEAMAYVTEVTE